MEERIRLLNQDLTGMDGLLCTHRDPTPLKQLGEWTRRRIRSYLWQQWRWVRTRISELRALGVKERLVLEIANTRKAWCTSKTSHLHKWIVNAN